MASQRTEAADRLARTAKAIFAAPCVFAFEVRNALLRAERQGRIAAHVSDEAIQFIITQLTIVEPQPDEALMADIVALSRTERLSFYDACYLEAALRLKATLASRDAALLQAASKRGAPIYDAR